MDEVLRSEISSDIIHGIFLRLPLKSLLRFRLISKNCLDIIDSLAFANMHMISTRDTVVEEHQLLYRCYNANCKNAMHSYIYDGKEIREIDHPIVEFSREIYGYDVETVAYGLLLFQNPHRVGEVLLYNPLRAEVLELPRPLGAMTSNGLTKEHLAGYGIGFDSIIGSYKIVRMCKKPMSIDNQLRFETEVYTLGTSSWRVIPSSVYFPLIDDLDLSSWKENNPPTIKGVSAYGDMHWKCWDYKNRNVCIMSFDFKKEEFKDTPLPNFGRQQTFFKQKLIDLKGFLAVFSFPFEDACIDLWVLKDYEKKEWVREYRITTNHVFTSALTKNSFTHRSDICLRRHLVTPAGVYSHGVVVFEYSSYLFVLDLNKNRILEIEPPRCYKTKRQDIRKFSYTGSILCLGNFGYPIAKNPYKYNFLFLKTDHRVYVVT